VSATRRPHDLSIKSLVARRRLIVPSVNSNARKSREKPYLAKLSGLLG
jgi:hypothetical protein